MQSNPAQPLAVQRELVVLPHEWCFGAFFALTWLRLALAGGPALVWSLVFLGGLLASGLVIAWARQNPDPFRWRVRLLFYPVAMGISFYAMEHSVPLLGLPKVDDRLLAWDRTLLGETPALAWVPWLRPWLVDVALAAYLFFFVYLIAGPGRYFRQNLALFRKCIVGLFVLYGLGFIGYTIFPAGGPHRFMTFEQPLEGIWLLGATLNFVNDGSNGVDAFPSIHFAATLYLLLFDWQHWRRRFWWLLVPCAVLWFSTMYLRFHYFVDLAGGLVVALLGWVAAQWFERNWSATAEPGQNPAHGPREPGKSTFSADVRKVMARCHQEPIPNCGEDHNQNPAKTRLDREEAN